MLRVYKWLQMSFFHTWLPRAQHKALRWFLIRELAAFIEFFDFSASAEMFYILRFAFWITVVMDYTTGGLDGLDCLLFSVLVTKQAQKQDLQSLLFYGAAKGTWLAAC